MPASLEENGHFSKELNDIKIAKENHVSSNRSSHWEVLRKKCVLFYQVVMLWRLADLLLKKCYSQRIFLKVLYAFNSRTSIFASAPSSDTEQLIFPVEVVLSNTYQISMEKHISEHLFYRRGSSNCFGSYKNFG